ncbi:hypothetical protein AMJ87_13600 [candidate division WOR_3 bacterium SM23_60]|uniref:Fibronectin type-III domain-containing protein n=1 Tax=candidate division WOR_3 bacterium SM23_60 TaxID=1703780 RepID=A0A0S8G2W4_UNCW3|nr:MAG: hypothetical protein AMJ87_13600 [candidate division WOR_3 bacterium SM23_60]
MKYAGRILGGVFLMLFLFTVSHAAVWYVDPGSPLNTIQAGLDSCSDGDIVIVAASTYYENLIWPNTQGIQLLSEAGPIYVKLDGNTAGSVIQITTGVDSTTVINGFQIRNGLADKGGAIYCINSSPTISNNCMQYNGSIDSSGGAIYCFNSSPVITGNHLAQNDAAGSGGAIYCENNSSPRISDNTFFSNTAFSGGAIGLDESSPLIVRNTFNWNTADSMGGGIYGRNSSSPTITENVMFANRCETSGSSSGGAIGMELNCEPTITKNTVHGNRGTQVGGIGCYHGIIADNTITDNAADYAGGIGIGLYGSVTVTSNLITNNTADYAGGGIICSAHSTSMIRNNIVSDNWAEFGGGGIVCDTSSTPTIRRNIITNNGTRTGFLAQHGGGIRCSDGAAPIIDSCIIADNDGEGIYCTDDAVPSIHYNEIEDNSEEGVRNADAGVTIDAENNWWGDPSGPGGSGPGSGDEVSSNVDYDPWLTTSMSDSVAPATPYVLNAKAGNDVELTWNMITTDTLGNAESVDYYVIYRSSSPSFVPGSADSIGAVFQPETTYTDVNALVAGSSYYYLVKAVDWKKNVSDKSNMAYVFVRTINENPMATDMKWTSLPW